MNAGSIRQLSIADLDESSLRRLIAHGETLFVERKESEPKGGIGPAVASFANTLGGWLLLGVADDGTIKGYEPGSGDFTDKVRHKLRSQIEPLPPFAATVVELDDVHVGIVRAFESSDTPHLVIATGSVPVREPGGTRHVQSRSELMDLARRGENARVEATKRLEGLPYALSQLDTTELVQGQKRHQIVVRAAPLSRPAGFADGVLSTSFGSASREVARSLFPGPPPADPRHRLSEISLGQRGFNVTSSQMGSHHRASVIADAGGVLVTRAEYPPVPARIHLRPESVEDDLKPLLEGIVGLFDHLNTRGRAVCDLLVRHYEGVEFVHQRAGSAALPDNQIHIGGEMTLPPDENELATLARQWTNELARASGLEVWADLSS